MNFDRKDLKYAFWAVAPLLFIALMRMFHVLFSAFLGALLLLIWGHEFIEWITSVAFVLGGFSGLVVAIAAFVWLYRQFKKYLVES